MFIHQKDKKEFFISENCFITELLNDPNLSEEISIAKARVKPNNQTEPHTLQSLEIYYILGGTGRATVGNMSKNVAIGDLVYIPKNTLQSIENTGSADLIFLCICLPRFVKENYRGKTELNYSSIS